MYHVHVCMHSMYAYMYMTYDMEHGAWSEEKYEYVLLIHLLYYYYYDGTLLVPYL